MGFDVSENTKCNSNYNQIGEVFNLSQAKPSSCRSQQNCISLELAIATVANASMEEFLAVMKQLPPDKRRRMVVNEILNSSLAEKVEVFKQVPLAETGEIAIAIAQVWQEAV